VNDKTITLSGGITNWKEAKLFCTKIGDGFKLASRADFNCKQTGLGCLDNKLFLPIKEKYGNRGFFWLEETEDLKKAYYADLNDGTIYNTSKSNSTTDEKYYQPVNEESEESKDPKEESNTVYEGSKTEKIPLKERKVTPVLPKTGSTDKLF
jgi:hypothetical protein